MNRLTKRNGIGYIARNKFCDYDAVLNDNELESAYQQCVDKLGQYEDIDEELGIDYITFNKLRKANKIYYLNDNNEIMEAEVFSIDIMNCYIRAIIISPYVYSWSFKDYGKTWALTREELKND